MAELVVGDRARLPLNSESVLVGRRSDDGQFVPDVDLADLEGGRTVSRRHARFFVEGGQWYIKVEPTITNQTLVGGRTLAPGEQSLLSDGDEIQLGRVAVIFRAEVPSAPAPESHRSTAELRAEGRTFPLDAPEGRSLTLGRHSDDREYVPDLDLGNLSSGKTVSRRHGLVYMRGGQWYLKVEAAVTNPTLLDGRQLALGEEVALNDGNVLQFGRVVVTFHQLVLVDGAGELIELQLEPVQLVVDPGKEVKQTITVVNHTGHVDWFIVELEGVPKSWYKIVAPDGTSGDKATVQLFNTPLHGKVSPDAQAKITLVIAPPRETTSRAGLYPLTVTATTQGEPPMRRVSTAQLQVTRFEGLVLNLDPGGRRGSRGSYIVSLQNTGNDVASVALKVTEDGLKTEWQKPLPQGTLSLANGAKDQLTLGTRVSRRNWLGMDRTYHISVVAEAGSVSAQNKAELICPPIIPIWLQLLQQRVMGFLAPILMLVTFIGILLATYLVLLKAPNPHLEIAPGATVAQGQALAVKWNLDGTGSVTVDPNPDPNKTLETPAGSLSLPTDKAGTQHYVLTSHGRFGILSTQFPFDIVVLPAAKIDTFDVQPSHITKEGDPVKISWVVSGATAVTITPDDEFKGQTLAPDKGDVTVHPKTATTTYTITAQGAQGTQPVTLSKSVVIDPPVLTSFTADNSTIVRGDQVTLTWLGQNFTKLLLTSNKGDVEPGKKEIDLTTGNTSYVAKPTDTTIYTLTASNAGGSVQKQVTVTVGGVSISAFDVNPKKIIKGQSATLTWQVSGATKIEIQPDVGTVPSNQTSVPVNPDKTTAYTLVVTGPDGSQVKSNPVTVQVGLGAATGTLTGPTTVTKGESLTLAYTYQNAKHIQISGSDGKTVLNRDVGTPNGTGTITLKPDQTTVYTFVITGDDGTPVPAQPFTLTVVAPTPTPAPTQPAAPAATPKP